MHLIAELLELLRDQQRALQPTPQSKETQVDNNAEHEKSDQPDPDDPSDRSRVLFRRPVRLILALVVAALLCAGGLRFWNYLQSYEWTDDAEIHGHLDPIST